MSISTDSISLPGSNSFFLHQYKTLRNSLVQLSDQIVFYLILNGNGQMRLHGQSFSIRTGDFLMFPRHTLYTLIRLNNLQLYELKFLPHFFETLCPELENIHFRHFQIHENMSDHRCNEIYQNLASFINAWLQNAQTLELVSLLSSLFLSVQRHFQDNGSDEENQADYVYERMLQIIKFVESNYRQKISIQDISRSLGLNPQYFSTFFSKQFGIQFVDFLNQYRVNASLPDLLHSDLSITEIALNSGFQTYRSYQNAFQKYNGQNPSDYRAQNHQPDPPDIQVILDPSLFDFLQVYLSGSDNPLLYKNYKEIHLQENLSSLPVLFRDQRIHAVNIGSGYLLLQESVYAQLQKAAAECPFTHVHFRDVFSDLLSVYSEPDPHRPTFLWDSVDEILQKIRRLHLYPYIELGYMPWELAKSKETLGFGYHPCIGTPRSLQLWEQMIRSFINHCIQKYGTEDLNNWRFGFWNTANICSSEGYWNGTKEEFFKLYLSAYKVFLEFSLTHLLGTPNFSLPEGIDWYDDFLSLCQKENIHPGFVDLHLYSCPDNLEEFNGIFPNAASTYNFLPFTSADTINNNIAVIRSIMARHGMQDLPIIAGEWNITYYLLDLIRDTAFMATYIVHTWIQTLSLLHGLTFSCLSDISEQTHPSSLPFPGTQGMIGRNGLTKPAYHAFFLLNKLDQEIIYNEYPCMITQGKEGWHILLYNISEYEKSTAGKPVFLLEDYRYNVFDKTQSIRFRASLKIPSGQYQIITYRIDQAHGCAYDAWIRMGRPRQFTDEVTNSLMHSSYPELHVEQRDIQETLNINEELLPHTVILYEIR